MVSFNKRIPLKDCMELPNSIFHTLFIEIEEKTFDEEGQKKLADENMSNKLMEGAGLI